MKIKACFAVMLLGIGFQAAYSQGINDSIPALTLEQCLEIALSESPTVKVADIDVERVDYSKKETLAQLFPQVSFSGQYSRTLAKQVMYMNTSAFSGLGSLLGGGAGGGTEGGDTEGGEGASSADPTTPAAPAASSKPSGIKMGLDNSYSVGFSASMPLIAPQLWASLKLNDYQILEAVEKARASKLDLVNQVKNAYYALLLASDSRRVIQQSYDMAALTNEIYTKKFSVGAASEFEVLRTSVAMKNIEPQLLQADIAVRQAQLQLQILMGVDSSFPVKPAQELADYEKTMYSDVLAINPDYSGNTQLRQFNIQSKQVEQALKIQRAAWYPTLAAAINYNWTAQTYGKPIQSMEWNPYSMFSLSLNLPLLTGGSRYFKIQQAKIQLQEMSWNRENIERSVNMQVQLAIDNINMNVKQIASQSENVLQAERAHDIMDRSFKIGAASYLDLRDSELSLTQSRLAYYQSIYNYLVARSGLDLLLGQEYNKN